MFMGQISGSASYFDGVYCTGIADLAEVPGRSGVWGEM
jgi:hypothetical protein